MMIRQARDPGAPFDYAAAGYDFAFIDMEHGNYSMETVADLIRGAKSAGIAPSSGFLISKLILFQGSSMQEQKESWCP